MKIYALFLLLVSSFYCIAQDTTYYSVVSKGKIKGYQQSWQSQNGDFNYKYQYNDRGRGDSTTTVAHLNNEGLISSMMVNGINYYKNAYEEIFLLSGDSAVWTVNGKRKSKPFNKELYVSNTAAPASFELLIQWLMKQPDKKAAILPDGSMHIDEPIQRSISLNGKTTVLKLVAVYFDPSPSPFYVWVTSDMKFFGIINSWVSNVKKGYESWCDSLLTMQELAGQPFYERQVNNNSQALASNILLDHVNVFQSSSATVLKDMQVEISNGKIAAVYPSSTAKNFKADSVIDCKGKFLMPGLWDMHGHFSKEEGAFYVAGGVTHVRDMGNDKILLTYKNQIAANKLLGPDLTYLSGFIDKEDPFQGPTGTMINSVQEGIKAINDYKRLGYNQIKLYSAIKPEWVKPMAEHAHKLGMKICGHIPAFMTAEQAINAGYDEITHMNFIFLNFMGDTLDTRTPVRFRKVGDLAGKLDVQSPDVKKFVELMKSRNVSFDPSMNVWQSMFDEFKGDTSSYLKPVISWLPQDYLSSLTIESPFGSEEQKPAYKAAFSNMLKMLKLVYDNGILIVAGTDGGEANALHHELELYVKAGIPSNEVLKIATYNAAKDCNLEKRLGDIKAGRDADIILIDGDPVKNISDVRRVEWVIKNNRIYLPKTLLASQGWKYYY